MTCSICFSKFRVMISTDLPTLNLDYLLNLQIFRKTHDMIISLTIARFFSLCEPVYVSQEA